jgi:hypothetical protein
MSKAKVKQEVRKRDGDKCSECEMSGAEHKRRFGRDLDLHRIRPGSEYFTSACVLLCRPCHYSKPKSPHYSRPHQRVRLSRQAHRTLRIIGAFAGMSPADFMAALITPSLRSDCEKLFDSRATAEDVCRHVYQRVLDLLLKQQHSLTISHPGWGLDVRLSSNKQSDECTPKNPSDSSHQAE